ncbi:glycosyltransferase family 8 protein [bacterium]|nr:glycosyltransferase family 8 protein [bacterium]
MSHTIHIAASCDDRYVPHVAVLFQSIMATAASPKSLHFHLISTQIAPQHLGFLQSMVTQGGAQLTIIPADDTKFAHMPTLRYGSAAYQRIALADYMDERIDKVIYLDSDIVVVDDIAKLWAQDLNGLPLAAVENLSPKACKDFGFQRQAYFNSGVLVVDLAQWRARDLLSEASIFIEANQTRLRFIDQCTLNGLFQGLWHKLPLRWNQQADIYGVYKKYADGCGYSKPAIEDAIKDPAVVHFIGKQKPWLTHCFHPFQSYYFHYLQQTPWAMPRPFNDASTLERMKRYFAFRRRLKQYRRARALAHPQP